MVTLTERDNGHRLPARLGDVIEIRLAENATSGFRWAPEGCDIGVLTLVETDATYANDATGSGGVAVFRFRVIEVGVGSISLKSWRRWEGDASIIARFKATIDATS